MRLDQVRFDAELIEDLIGGRHAADPLDSIDTEELVRAWNDTERARHASCGLTQSIRIIIAAAYSLGARHALEQTERWTIAPAAECEDTEQVDLSQDVQPAQSAVQPWRSWTELSDCERFDILHSKNPPTLFQAKHSLWRETPEGWEWTTLSALAERGAK